MDWGRLFGNTASGALTGTAISPGWGSLIGGGVGLLSSLFGDDPNEKAQQQTQKGWEESKGFQEPYARNGIEQYDRLNKGSLDLMNPEYLQNKWAAGYKTSPYANQLLSQNQSSGMDAAQQMGLGGSSAALGNIQQGAGNIVNQDRQQYMNDLMEKYMKGIGLGQSLYSTGASAASKLGEQSVGNGLVNAAFGYNRADQPMQNLATSGAGLLNAYQKNPNLFGSAGSGNTDTGSSKHWYNFFS